MISLNPLKLALISKAQYAIDAAKKISVAERDELDEPLCKYTLLDLVEGNPIILPTMFEIERHDSLRSAEDKEWAELEFHNQKIFEAYNAIKGTSNFESELSLQELQLLKLSISQMAIGDLISAIHSSIRGESVNVEQIEKDLQFCGLLEDKVVLRGLSNAKILYKTLPDLTIACPLTDDLIDLYCMKMRESLLFVETNFN